jgi:polysaccharide export outer membrane protein
MQLETHEIARHRALAWALAVFALGFAACAGDARSAAPPEVGNSVASPYVIGAADQLSIRVWKNPELSVDVPVRPDGKISVPLLDDVQAAGLTTEELKELITRELEEFVASPDVTIVVTNTASKRVFMLGAVARNAPVALNSDTRITDAIAAAGGFNTFANKKKVRVIRREGTEEQEFWFNYDAYVKGKAPGTNILLRPGDTVVVPD